MKTRMKTPRMTRAIGALAALTLVAAACGGDDDDAADDTPAEATEAESSEEMSEVMSDEMSEDMSMECDTPREMSLQLQWFTQAQFAGYYAADAQGFFADHCLDVEIVEGGLDIVPQTQLANGDVDFALAWVPKALASREAGDTVSERYLE